MITFDADGTLWDFERVTREGLRRAVATLESRIPAAKGLLSPQRLAEIRDAIADETECSGQTHTEIRHRAFAAALESMGSPDQLLARELTEDYLRYRFTRVSLFSDVVPALDALSPRYRLGIVSNGNSCPDLCGLPGRFSFEVFSERDGVAKPDPAIFGLALGRSGAAPSDLLHVGDSLVHDATCALAAGCRAVWMNRTGTSPAAIPDGVPEIRSLLELPRVADAPPGAT